MGGISSAWVAFEKDSEDRAGRSNGVLKSLSSEPVFLLVPT
jgi:hypothetical protein